MRTGIETKTIDELNAMHTGSLMKRREALLKCEESAQAADLDEAEQKALTTNTGLIRFKNTPIWQKAYADIKKVLSTREHLPNKQERKELRKAKARKTS